MTVPVMWKLQEAADKTGLSYYYLRNLCLQGKIIHVKSGNKYLINADKLIEYLNNGDAAQGMQNGI